MKSTRGWMRSIALLAAALHVGLLGTARAEGAVEDAPEPVTTANPAIPVAELELLMKPLTVDELETEAQAWLALLKAKVAEISAAQISVRRRTAEIRKAEDVVEAAGEAQQALQEAGEAESGADGAEAEIVAAGEAIAEMAKTEADSEVAEDAGETVAAGSEEAKPEVAAPVESATRPVTSAARPSGLDAADGSPDQVDSSEELAAVQARAERAVESKAEAKEVLLENVNELRAERTAIIDRLRAVLEAWQEKGGEVQVFELYIKAVEGIEVDVSDTTATWATVVGWITSREGGLRWAANVGWFIAITTAFWLLSIIVGRALYKALGRARHVSALLRDIVSAGARRLVFIIGVIVGLSALEINVAPVLAVIGAAGFVVAFALQGTLSNFASGIMILLYKPYDIGDVVDAGGATGTVSSMNLVSTEIRTFDNQRMLVPNNAIWGDIITNVTGTDRRRVDMVFGIGYESSIARAEQVLEEIVSAHPLVLPDPAPTIKVHELADSSVNFICRPWARTEDVWTVHWDITRAVKERFDQEGISIPFPQRDVRVYPVAGDAAAAAPALAAAPRP